MFRNTWIDSKKNSVQSTDPSDRGIFAWKTTEEGKRINGENGVIKILHSRLVTSSSEVILQFCKNHVTIIGNYICIINIKTDLNLPKVFLKMPF